MSKIVAKFWKKKYLFVDITLLYALLTWLPSNLFVTISEKYAFLSGLRVDYLILKLYLSQLLIAIACLITFWTCKTRFASISKKVFLPRTKVGLSKWLAQHKKVIGLVLLTIVILVRQLFSTCPLISGGFLIQLTTAGSLSWWLKNQPTKILHHLDKALLLSLFIQISLSIFQFITQKSLFPYYIFGEPRFEPYLSVARHIFWGKEKVLAYGSTPHPNVLAGVSVIFWLILLRRKLVKEKKIPWSLIINLLGVNIILFLTQSFSALLTLFWGTLWLIMPYAQFSKSALKSLSNRVIFSAFFFVQVFAVIAFNQLANYSSSTQSIIRRADLNQAGINIFKKYWFSGVGLNQFVINLEEYSNSTEIVRFVQPAHHVGLLWLAETGLLGVSWLGCLILNLSPVKRTALLKTVLILSPILVLDHYLYSLLPGNLAFFLLLNQLEDKAKN